jgi:hypothetical protein
MKLDFGVCCLFYQNLDVSGAEWGVSTKKDVCDDACGWGGCEEVNCEMTSRRLPRGPHIDRFSVTIFLENLGCDVTEATCEGMKLLIWGMEVFRSEVGVKRRQNGFQRLTHMPKSAMTISLSLAFVL